MIFELAVFHPDSVLIAQQCNVSRIELCDEYQVGGITPSIENFKYARRVFQGPIMVMIRPVAGEFVYDKSVINKMIDEIELFNNLGADGFVFGCLTSDKRVNASQLARLVDACIRKPVTFHRAIDSVLEYEIGIQRLIKCGVTSVLTTCQEANALQGKDKINEMILKYGSQLNFIAGGGVRSNNVVELLADTSISEIHSAAITDSINFIADKNEVQSILEKIQL